VSPNLEERVEQYQEAEGFSNKSDAVRDLVETGLDKYDQPAKSFPLPYAVMWFGTLMLMIPVQPGPGTSPETIAVLGGAIFLTGLALGHTEILAKLRQ